MHPAPRTTTPARHCRATLGTWTLRCRNEVLQLRGSYNGSADRMLLARRPRPEPASGLTVDHWLLTTVSWLAGSCAGASATPGPVTPPPPPPPPPAPAPLP